LKNLIDNLKSNALEYWTLLMILVGLPLIAFIYAGWALALTVFVLTNIIIGILNLKKDSK
jgi:hypothetical protein